MIAKRSYPRSFETLATLVGEATKGAESVAMQAGHFLVYYDHTEDQLLPCVASEISGPRHEIIRNEVGHFPLLTWDMGVKLLAAVPAKRKHALVLVNDWQYLPSGVDRGRFYEKFNRLPQAYRRVLDQTGDSVALLRPPRLRKALHTGDFFSEQTLRNQYGKHVKQLIAEKSLPPNAELLADGDSLSCNLVDAVGRRQEIYCAGKSENCTHEVAELLYSVHEITACDMFINIFPLVCKEYVEAGTELNYGLFQTHIGNVINIGMVATGAMSFDQLLDSAQVVVQSTR